MTIQLYLTCRQYRHWTGRRFHSTRESEWKPHTLQQPCARTRRTQARQHKHKPRHSSFNFRSTVRKKFALCVCACMRVLKSLRPLNVRMFLEFESIKEKQRKNTRKCLFITITISALHWLIRLDGCLKALANSDLASRQNATLSLFFRYQWSIQMHSPAGSKSPSHHNSHFFLN